MLVSFPGFETDGCF